MARGHFGNHKVEIAAVFGFLESRGHSRGEHRRGILNRGAVLLKQLVNGFPGIAQEGEIIGYELSGRIDFMGDAGRELADTFKLLRLAKLAFQGSTLSNVAGGGETVFLPVEPQVVRIDLNRKKLSLPGLRLAFKGHCAPSLELFPKGSPGFSWKRRAYIRDREGKKLFAGTLQNGTGRLVGINDMDLRVHPLDAVGSVLDGELG